MSEIILVGFMLAIFALAVIGALGFILRLLVQPGTPSVVSQQPSPGPTFQSDWLDDLTIAERVLARLFTEGKLQTGVFEATKRVITAERVRTTQQQPTTDPTDFKGHSRPVVVAKQPSVTPKPFVFEPPIVPKVERAPQQIIEAPAAPTPKTKTPRRSFTEVLNSFMEESNIRWGEIVGGLLIIGCSTALVVSLWSQISEIPVLKFLIFTTVTAVLFGIGMYTEHRWKLPTTSRGILTIATLLVPLNFLAIAAVSSSAASGFVILGSELLAPAIFLCLVYFAGRIITPGFAHLLSAGILGSSIGQILVRHFASAEASPEMLVFLGAFPVVCYVVAIGFVLRRMLLDQKIDETETTTLFTILGTMSFAALLPFGLLLYKSGPFWMTMMYLAPLVTLAGVPMLATGTVLWKRIQDERLVTSRTAGTAIGVLGLMVVMTGMVLAWPNPASVVVGALIGLAIFTALAIALELPVAHLLAAGCFSQACLVSFHVVVGNIRWQNLRVESLLHTTLQISSGHALTAVCAILLITAESLTRKQKVREGYFYLVAACAIGVLGLIAVTLFGPVLGSELQAVWITYFLCAVYALYLSWRNRSREFAWVGIALLLFADASAFAWNTTFSFPWQTALLVHATFCSVAAILCSRRNGFGVLARPLSYAGLISCVLGAVSMFQTNPWQVTSMQAERIFWISGIMLVSLWLNRRRALLVSLQIGLTAGVILSVKAALQQYEWYTYLPHAFLHPAGLQIQGAMLALLGLVWIAMRFSIKRLARDGNTQLQELWTLLDAKYSVDQIVNWIIAICFVLLAVYSALSGVAHEFEMFGSDYQGWNVAGFPHQEAYSIGSWIVMGLLLLIMLASAWERRKHIYVLGAALVASAAIPLLAARFEDQPATSTGWRFLAAVFLVGGSVLIWQRIKVRDLFRSVEWPALDLETEQLAVRLRYLCLAITAGPILLLTIYPALRLVFHATVNTPASGLFSTFDHGLLYAVPLVATALVLIGYAIREREPLYAFWAGPLFNLTVTLSFVLAVVSPGAPLDATVVVTAIQLNVVTFAVYALLWLSLRQIWTRALATRSALADKLLRFVTQLGALPGLGILFTFALNLVVTNLPGFATVEAASLLGWFALVVTVVSYALVKSVQGREFSAAELSGTLFSILCLVTFGLADVVQLRVLTLGLALVAWMMFGASNLNQLRLAIRLKASWTRTSQRISVWAGAIAVFLGLRLLPTLSSNENWWSISTFVMLSVLAALLNWQTLQRKYIYASGLLLNVAVTVWYLLDPKTGFDLYELNIFVSGFTGVVYLVMELRARRLGNDQKVGWSYHHIVLGVSTLLLMLITWAYYLVRSEIHLGVRPWSWLALLSIVSLMVATLWDRHVKYAVGGLYFLGLLAAAMALQQFQVYDHDLIWTSTIILSAYSVVTSLIWHRRSSLYSVAEKWKVPLRVDPNATELWWLSTFSAIVVALIAVATYSMNVTPFSFGQRITAAIALMVQSVTLGLIATGPSRRIWQRASVACVLVGAVLFCWSWLTPGLNDTWLNRSVILMVFSFVLIGICVFTTRKIRPRDWAEAVQSCIPAVIGVGLLALVFCLCTELSYKLNFGEVRVSPVSLVAIGATLIASVFIAILFALRSEYDPLSLGERGRMGYVYAAEVLLGLLFFHVRLTMPWLFTGFFERYWPLVVMAVAYVGVTASEWLRRREVLVVSQPLSRTGAFLPLLPVVGFWIAASEVDYSSLLFVVGGLYGLLSVMRKSLLFGVLAAVAGNAGLWHLLERTDSYQFVQHPQMFLIPAAMSVLIAAYLNEDRLSEEQMAGARYLSLVAIYASSTADIFINGVENSPWLPLVLGGLSLTGVLAGIMLRIRGMLLLGSVFLLLSITTMIWYASANFGWTWLWYVAGIATGATIIFMFALFEKKRTEVLRVVDGFREWEA